jgi:hypothetical protein
MNYNKGVDKHMNKLIKFCLPKDMQKFLEQYPASDNEVAFAKGIPATEANHRIIDQLSRIVPLRRRYRGNSKPLYDRPVSFVHRRWADTIALYPKTEYGPNGYTWMGEKI